MVSGAPTNAGAREHGSQAQPSDRRRRHLSQVQGTQVPSRQVTEHESSAANVPGDKELPGGPVSVLARGQTPPRSAGAGWWGDG